MKTTNKILAVLIFIISITSSVYSQTLFVENFNYPVRDSLQGMGGWMISGAYSPYNVKIKSPGLTYAGYLGSGIGNNVYFSNDDGNIVLNDFSDRTSGTVYMSFLIRVDSLTADATYGFNISFDELGGATAINTRPCVKKVTSSTFNFGIVKTDSLPLFNSTVYSTNTTYLVVTKYTFVPGTRNDSSKIYVFNSGIPSSEPVSPLMFQVNGGDVTDIGEVALSNSYSQSGLKRSSVKIDGIRIGTTWSNTLFADVSFHLNLTALIQGFYNEVTDKMVKDTARVYLRYDFAPYAIVDSAKSVLDSSGKGVFLFGTIVNNNPYYIAVRHRNSIETWSAIGNSFYMNNMNYDFTYSSSQAFSNNLATKGFKYCIYGGDVDQDGNVNLLDMILTNNDATSFASGYKKTDLNGDNVSNLTDMIIAYNNSNIFVAKITP